MKAYYIASVFRYEKPQNGRLREHHQFGVECYGSDSPYADAEVIALAYSFLKEVGLESLELNLNSIGCPTCRAEYNKALKAYIGENLHAMCAQCQTRFDKNPLRILDCKEEKCKAITANAPKITDFLCDDCKAHFEKVQSLLKRQNIPFSVNPSIVRGLDYYTRTVFEFVSTDIGAQGTVCGGGRYNNLVEEVGGKPTPAVGFGLGLERLLLVLENTGRLNAPQECTRLYILPIGDAAKEYALQLAGSLREQGVSVETDIMDRGVKAQMKYADKSAVGYVIVLGDDEINSGRVRIKNMSDGSETECVVADIASVVK